MIALCEIQLAFGDVVCDVGQDGPAGSVVDGVGDGEPADQPGVRGGHGGVNPTAWPLLELPMANQ